MYLLTLFLGSFILRVDTHILQLLFSLINAIFFLLNPYGYESWLRSLHI